MAQKTSCVGQTAGLPCICRQVFTTKKQWKRLVYICSKDTEKNKFSNLPAIHGVPTIISLCLFAYFILGFAVIVTSCRARGQQTIVKEPDDASPASNWKTKLIENMSAQLLFHRIKWPDLTYQLIAILQGGSWSSTGVKGQYGRKDFTSLDDIYSHIFKKFDSHFTKIITIALMNKPTE